MLAIVFWNARKRSADARHYASALARFHAALNAHKPKGFRFSASYRVESLPWFDAKTEIYEDWYVLSNFAAIDVLDHAVMHTARSAAHRDLMTYTAAASGAIVGLKKGVASLTRLPAACWLQRPRGVTVEHLTESMRAQNPGGKFSVWTRALALGPAEHCVLSSAPLQFPHDYHPLHVQRSLFWLPPARQR